MSLRKILEDASFENIDYEIEGSEGDIIITAEKNGKSYWGGLCAATLFNSEQSTLDMVEVGSEDKVISVATITVTPS